MKSIVIITTFLTLFTLSSNASEDGQPEVHKSGPYRELDDGDVKEDATLVSTHDAELKVSIETSTNFSQWIKAIKAKDEDTFQGILDVDLEPRNRIAGLKYIVESGGNDNIAVRMRARLLSLMIQSSTDTNGAISCTRCAQQYDGDIYARVGFTTCCGKPLCYACSKNQTSFNPCSMLKQCHECSSDECQITGIKIDVWEAGDSSSRQSLCSKIMNWCSLQ